MTVFILILVSILCHQ